MDVSSMSQMNPFMGQMSGMGARPGPGRMFEKVDTDQDGGLNQSEFQTLADKIGEKTGESLDVEEVFNTYDTDGDGMLSAEETHSVMEAHKPSGGPPPGGGPTPGGGPPPNEMMGIDSSDSLAIEQYAQTAALCETEDLISTLLEAMSENDEDNETDAESLFSINIDA